MSLSDGALLEHLNKHPELRGRVESMLLVVADELGELQEADAAEMAFIEQKQRLRILRIIEVYSGVGHGWRLHLTSCCFH